MDEGVPGFCTKTVGGDGGGGGTKCGRWNPTSEQVRVLTDLFRSGLRTPSTDQIRKISSQLSLYGKIESKNVFYWFQNHKARERQKRRKVSATAVDDKFENRHSDKLTKHSEEEKHGAVWNDGGAAEEYERAMETLQLFPLSSPDNSSEPEKPCKENSPTGHPPLDLRLSFM